MINWIYFLFLGTFGWGISLYLNKILLISLTPTEIVIYRMAIGTFTLFVFVKMLKIRLNNFKYLVRDGVIVGIFNMSIPFYLTVLVEKTVSSSMVAVMNGLTPLFTFMIGSLFFTANKKFNPFIFLSIVFSVIGVVLLNLDFSPAQMSLIDFMALLAIGFSYGIAANYIKFISEMNNSLLIAAVSGLISTVLMLIFKFSESNFLHWQLPHNTVQVFALLWLGIVGSGLCLYFYYLLIQNRGATFASMVTYLMTTTAVIIGIVFLHENMSGMTLLGCFFVWISFMILNHVHH